MASNQEEQPNININSDNNPDKTTSINNNQQNSEQVNLSPNQQPLQNNNLNKSEQFQSQDIRLNKLNTNSSITIPQNNIATHLSLNEQTLHQKKEQSDYFDNDGSYQDDDDNDPMFKEYTMINNKRNNAIDNIKNINERIKNNNLKIEEIKKNLIKLKEEKRQKQSDIVNLLSNKESIEEVYKNQIYSLNSQHSGNISGSNLIENNDSNNLINISMKNDINDNSMIHLNSNHNITIDNEILNNDEDNFKITLNEIKESDPKKYIEQVISMFEDIFKTRDDKINISLSDIIKNSYQLFVNNKITENDTENNNNEIIVNNFFGKLSIFISNHSLGKYSESKINLFLRYLLKINAINVKLTKYIKFVNKKYKEKKKELNDMINFLEKKNSTLSEKKTKLEDNMKEYTERLEFYGKNDVFAIEQRFENDDDIEDNERKRKFNIRNKNMNARITNPNDIIKKIDNEDQLSHDVVIEYEDGIDQNVEINYEEDDLANEYDYEKENEMINRGLNPYNSENIQYSKFNTKKNSVLNKEKMLKNKNKQIIVNDTDESDRYLKEFLQNKESNTNIKEKNKHTKSEGVDYLVIEDDDNKDFIDINDDNLFEDNINNNKLKNDKKERRYSYQTQKVNKMNDSYNLVKKNVYNIKTTVPNNVLSDNRIYPTQQSQIKTQKDLEKLSDIELAHYNRIQRIMNTGQKVNNIFGVNNYNPENSVQSINIDNSIFSPKKSSFATTNNKIDKTIRIGSRQNHNFISIINMTKTVPVKKKKDKDKTKNKEKRKGSRADNNDGIIQIINLEENFLHELKDEEKNENENKTGNESTSNITNNNNSKGNNSKDKIDNEEKSNNNNNNKNEVQGYYLNIINSKQQSKETEKKDNKEARENEDKLNKNENNELFTNSNKKTMKVTKSRELNINDIKNINVNKKISKANANKNNGGKAKTKLFQFNNTDNKDELQVNKENRQKTNNSLNKIVNHKKVSGYISSCFNTSVSSNKRSRSLSENGQLQIGDNNNKNNTKIVVINTDGNINNANASPYIQKTKKIPVSKIKKTNLNFNPNEGNIKKEVKEVITLMKK